MDIFLSHNQKLIWSKVLTQAQPIPEKPEAINHFCFILNAIISDMANVTSPILNTVYANILYKGHGKDKTIDNNIIVTY